VFEGVKLQNKIDLQTQINLFFSLKKLNIDTSPRQSQGAMVLLCIHQAILLCRGNATALYRITRQER
jgi:hypothetical protein